MIKAKTGLIVAASEDERGNQRAEELMKSAEKALEKREISVVTAGRVVRSAADAVEVCELLRKEEPDSLTMIISNRVPDTLLYLFVNRIRVPCVLWAVPFAETGSLGCVQHFGSILTSRRIAFDYVCGLPEEESMAGKAAMTAEAGRIIRSVRNLKIALALPEQDAQDTGLRDTTEEEWDLSGIFGSTILHFGMNRILKEAAAIPDREVRKKWNCLKKRTGKVESEDSAMMSQAGIYLALKKIMERYQLDAMTAECYYQYRDLMNLPASWLADEGIVFDTAGDIGSCILMFILNQASKGGAAALCEVGMLDDGSDTVYLSHEGSTAHSLASTLDDVRISRRGERGAVVGFPMMPMDAVTVAGIYGGGRSEYRVFVAGGSVREVSKDMWKRAGSGLIVGFQPGDGAGKLFRRMMDEGADRHILVKAGNYEDLLKTVCRHLGLRTLSVD